MQDATAGEGALYPFARDRFASAGVRECIRLRSNRSMR